MPKVSKPANAPAVTPQSPLQFAQQDRPERRDLARCWRQKEPARKLVHLSGIPIVIIAAEASYHAVYDHCTANYLRQAGATTTFVRLEDRGLRGNGHMVMLEKNSLDVAALLRKWIVANIK